MAPIAFVGVATDDTIALVERFPGRDERVLATDLVRAGGGPAATAAVAAARLGAAVALVTTIGSDAEGERVVAELAAEGIDVSGVTRVVDHPTAASIVVVDEACGTRAIVHRPGPPIVLGDVGARIVDGAEWVHVDHAGWAVLHGRWRDGAPRPRVSVDGGNPIPGFSAAAVDLYVPTVAALRDRYGDHEPHELLRTAVDEGAATVVATDGSRGAYVLGRDQPFVHVPAVRGPVHSTLGAGDVFHGALLAGVARGRPIEQCVALASEIAYRSCQGLDGRSAIPRRTEVTST